MHHTPSRIVRWVGTHILPHEPAVRAWLRRSRLAPEDIDDLIQEAYCKLSALDSVDHIDRPDRYFFQVVRHLVGEQLRRSRVVRFETMAEIDTLALDAQAPSLERTVAAANELSRVRKLIESLPERCRQIFRLRKVEGLSQREVAQKLGVSESVVENEGVKGMRFIVQALKESGEDTDSARTVYGHSTKRG